MTEASDFDFLHDEWKVHNRRLRERLAGSDEWDEFEATLVVRPTLDGLGNEDELRTDYDGGFVGMSFRFFDPAARQWSIYWSGVTSPTPRWGQAFSEDGGKTWETNWVGEFTRGGT